MNETASFERPAKLRPPRTTADSLDLLHHLESRYPVDRWRSGDLHVWPLVRYDLCTRNSMLIERSGSAASVEGRVAAVRARVETLAKQTGAWVRARARDAAGEDRIRRADLLLYSDGASFTELSGKWVERFCDPLVDLGKQEGLSSLVVTPIPLGATYTPRRTPSVLIQPAIDASAQVAAAVARLRPDSPKLDLEGFDEMVAELKRELPALFVCDRERLRRIVVYVETFAALYRRMLRRVQPRAVFVVCYYGAERQSMLRAARQLGIPSVDIQHGASATHWAFAQWERLPPDGYELLPTFFWCWDRASADAVDGWASGHRHAHRAVVGGNPFLDLWKGESPVIAEYDERVKRLLDRAPGKERILLTANGLETPEQLDAIAALIARTEDRADWWIRMHPCRLEKSAMFENALRRAGATAWTIREATDLPLYALLRFVDFHVTEMSSTIIEAAEMGVPSVLTLVGESKLFAALIDQGWALSVRGFADAERGLATQRDRRPALRATLARNTGGRSRAALAEILAFKTGSK